MTSFFYYYLPEHLVVNSVIYFATRMRVPRRHVLSVLLERTSYSILQRNFISTNKKKQTKGSLQLFPQQRFFVIAIRILLVCDRVEISVHGG